MKPDVLIVDDSLTVRMDLGEAFESADFTTTLCETAAAVREVSDEDRIAERAEIQW